MANRIELHTQLKAFYSIVFNGAHDIRPTHISLYMFLLNQNNRNNWAMWFKCPWDLAMQGAAIQSKTTYYTILDELCKFGLLEWEKGINLNKSPRIKLTILTVSKNDTLTGTVPVPLSDTIPDTVPDTLTGNNIRLITNNYTLLNKYESDFEKFINDLKNKPEMKNFWASFEETKQIFFSEEEKGWRDIVMMSAQIKNEETLFKALNVFLLHQAGSAYFPHEVSDTKRFFLNWYKKNKIELEQGTNETKRLSEVF